MCLHFKYTYGVLEGYFGFWSNGYMVLISLDLNAIKPLSLCMCPFNLRKMKIKCFINNLFLNLNEEHFMFLCEINVKYFKLISA